MVHRFSHIPCYFEGCPFRTYEGHACGRIGAMREELEREAGQYFINKHNIVTDISEMEALRERIGRAIKRLLFRHRVDAIAQRQQFKKESARKVAGA